MKLTTKLRSLRKKHAELERRYNDTTIPMTEREVHSNLEQRGKIESEAADLERRIDAGEVDEPTPVAAKPTAAPAAPTRDLVSWDELHGVLETVKGYIDRTADPMLADIAELKSRPQMEYMGVFDGTKEYQRGNFVTSDGSLGVVKGKPVASRERQTHGGLRSRRAKTEGQEQANELGQIIQHAAH